MWAIGIRHGGRGRSQECGDRYAFSHSSLARKKLTVVPVSCETRGTTMRLLCVMIAAKQRYPFVPALDRSDFYLRQAKEAFRLAHTVHDDRRRAFIELAAAWQRFADFSDRSDGFETKLQ
jgi:hypothetical protein